MLPMTIGDGEAGQMIAPAANEIIGKIEHFIVENIRTSRRYIRALHKNKNIDEICFYELNKHTKEEELSGFLLPAEKQAKDIGLLSEAGMPGIADPGAKIVADAHRKNIQVVPLPGPSSLLLALSASGMNGQSFAFCGYLPVKPKERAQALKAIENRSAQENQSQIFMETPYRNNKLLDEILKKLRPNSSLCIAADISSKNEFIQTRKVTDWRKKKPDLHKRPAIFILHAGYKD